MRKYKNNVISNKKYYIKINFKFLVYILFVMWYIIIYRNMIFFNITLIWIKMEVVAFRKVRYFKVLINKLINK